MLQNNFLEGVKLCLVTSTTKSRKLATNELVDDQNKAFNPEFNQQAEALRIIGHGGIFWAQNASWRIVCVSP